jgi:hypothetical protein
VPCTELDSVAAVKQLGAGFCGVPQGRQSFRVHTACRLYLSTKDFFEIAATVVPASPGSRHSALLFAFQHS